VAWVNRVLEALPQAELRLLEPQLERVDLVRNTILVEEGTNAQHVFLPVNCILSVMTAMRDGSLVESRTIGREGGFGLLHALGARLSFERLEVQVSGEAWRLPIGALEARATESPEVRRELVRHAQATLVQSVQATACNALHAAEQRLCRWLLLTQDRLGADLLPLTQEHLSIMLGVQRTTVTGLASALQAKRLISYSRGKIRILDRAALERCACECYEAMTRGAERMLADPASYGA
jgi:CRP-like cAMP-binding protein